ncbi:MAG: (1-_4)-alpha-D-glucan 1-alpha-D-glucosylmutase, partial [Gammaproteobacteria bacterium]
MPITDHEAFERLSALSGIVDSYYDIGGVHHVASFEAKKSLLKAMHMPVENDADIVTCLEKIERRDWQHTIAVVLVYQLSESPETITLTLGPAQTGQPIHWQIIEEQGQVHEGHWTFEPDQAFQQSEFEGSQLLQFHAHLPAISALGYHRLKLQLADETFTETLLIVTPESCYQPTEFEAGQKLWGIGLQLYALRSKRNWGIGDFSDLSAAIKILAPLGVDVIGLNPLHALFSHLPENASPYSPSSRDFLNPVYLDIECIEEFAHCEAAQKLVKSDNFQQKLQNLRDADLVDYSGVWSIKLEVLEFLYSQFSRAKPPTVKQFRQFQIDGGEDLFKFGLFEALQLFFYQQDAAIETWQQWPESYQDPDSDDVKTWAESKTESIEFHQYLQWQISLQLSTANANCQQQGMRLGLYNDLAVGNERFSSQCWAKQSQFALGVGVGAPPDQFNQLGQNWGLPPQLPQALSDNAYQLFIRTLRTNMRHAGALRIDHVMGLMRLYWVPEGCSADQGTYVNYPLADLLGILALESQRNRCLVIGEDLGTVADEVRHQLWLKKVLSYRILYFEKDWHQGSFKRPDEYPPYALCTAGSHDLPTLKGYWQEADIALRQELDLFPSEEFRQQQLQYR